MEIYLTIITTALVLTQIIRVTQNHISLRRQAGEIRKTLKWFDEQDISEKDFETQREVFRLLRDKLVMEGMDRNKKCYTCGWLGDDGAESGGESPCCYCLHHELWCPKESEADDEQT